MRTLSTDALAAVNTAKGTKPLILLEIQWVESGAIYKYADKNIGAYSGQILNISTIDEIVKITGGSNNGEVSIVLNDTDGTLKNFVDTQDIHKRPVWIYQLFEGLDPAADKFLLMRGEVNSPVIWDEGAQQLSFKVVTQIESTEVGFSIEEGQFPLLPIDLVGKSWPLAFGSVVNVPALRITSPRSGILADGFGIHDYTIRRRLQLAHAICCPANSIIGYDTSFGTNPANAVANTNPNTGQPSDVTALYGSFGSIATGNQVIDPGALSGSNNSVANGTTTGNNSGVTSKPIYGPDPACIENRCSIVEQLNFDLANQSQFEFTTFKVFGGEQFEQNVPITLAIGGAYVEGHFIGDIFHVTRYIHRDAVDNKTYSFPPTQTQIDFILNQDSNRRSVLTGYGSENPADATAAFLAVAAQGPGTIQSSCGSSPVTDVTNCQSTSLKSLNDYPTSSFQWVNAGSKVTYAFDEEIVYIANIIPSTVRCVAAFRTLDNGQRLLLVVPEDYYTVRTTDYSSYHVVEIVMNKALSLQGDGWEDDIYVTQDSSVGPNTIDILEWLITTYTDFDIDATSFDAVEILIDHYPSHFALLERKNILQALDEISFQARCALYLRDNTFFIKYLALTPTTVDTFTEDHVTQNTLKLTSTPTEDLVTKMVVTWNDDLALDPKLLILRNNINRYGVIQQEFNFYIYNMYSLVEKSAIFWLIRKSNTWRLLTLTTPLVKLPFETYDDILVDLPDICNSPIPAQIQKATLNPDGNSIDFEIWTSSVAGTRVKYPWAYPGSTTADQIWPPDVVAQGPGFGVVAPTGHPLSSTTFPSNVPDDVTAPNFTVSNCAGPPTPNTNFCCTAVTQAQPSEFCQVQFARRTDDANDVKPPARTADFSCPGAVNLGPNPVFAQQEPKFKAILAAAQQAQQQAAVAKDTALNAGGGLGGGGGAGGQNEDDQHKKTDVFDKIPKKKPATPGSTDDEGKPADCTSTLAISWFPITGITSGGHFICVPALPGGVVFTEVHTFGGCASANKADGSGGALQQMKDLLISKGFGADTFELCDGGYFNSPCCHATIQIISPNCDLCGKGPNDGEWMNVAKSRTGSEPDKSFASIMSGSEYGNYPSGYPGT